MASAVVVVGIGQLGGVFSQGFLKQGRTVVPVLRGVGLRAAARDCPAPELVLIAVAENDLDSVLAEVPGCWQNRLVLLQNELLPCLWQAHGIEAPTVAVVWFEKKKGIDVSVLRPTAIFGPQAPLTADALAAMAISTRLLSNPADLLFALVCKNVFVLTINIAGLVVGGTTGELWADHRDLALAVAGDVFAIQEKYVGGELDRRRVMADLALAMNADPHHRCAGRAAPQRLERALAAARRFGLAADNLKRIGRDVGQGIALRMPLI
jgi:hypothetical protein